MKRNMFWRSRPIKIDKLRCFAAYVMSEAGGTHREIAEVLGVSTATAMDFVHYGKKWFEEGSAP